MQDMREVEFVPFRLTEVAEIFSIKIVGKEHSELQDFLIAFKSIESPDLHKDFEQILKILAGIAQEGAKQSFFRQEGKMKDRVCAIPLLTSHRQKHKGTLRLYCIRICQRTAETRTVRNFRCRLLYNQSEQNDSIEHWRYF